MLKKKKLILIVILIIIVGILIALIFSLSKTKDEKITEREIKTEATEIINANKGAVQKAREEVGGQIKAINENDHILGQLGAPVQFIVYSDFECQFCADFSDTVEQAVEEFGDKVVVAFRNFPMTTINSYALSAAIASECAAEQGKFWEMHDKLFSGNSEGNFGAEQFKKDAIEIGLDETQFNKCLDEEKYKDKVEAQIAEGRDAGILGTPQSYVNGQALPGAYPFEDFTDSQKYERTGMKNIILKHLEKINK